MAEVPELMCTTVPPAKSSQGLGFRVYGFSKIRAAYWDPHNKDYNFLGSLFGSPCFPLAPAFRGTDSKALPGQNL